MKLIKLLVSTAMVVTMPTPFVASPAMATITPSSTTLAAEESQCSADLGANAGILLHDGTHAFTTEVEESGQVDGAPVEVPGTRLETPGTRHGTGTPTYSGIQIVGDPYKVGGSVNMFGLQGAKYKNWPNSEYDFTADFDTTTTISYKCVVTQHTEIYVPADPGHKVQGLYVNCDFGHGQGNDNGGAGTCDDVNNIQGSCVAHNNTGDSLPFWGEDTEQCKFIVTAPAVPPTPEHWDAGPDVARPDLDTMHTINETNRASGSGHEVNGGPFTETAPTGTLYNAGQVVICISPSKTTKSGVPGAWQNQNGYTGTKCTTAWYTVAPWGAGTSGANGTLISVPAV